MRSMTGYGRGEQAQGGFKFSVELNAVNRKQSDLSIRIPPELEELEPRIRDEINERIARGRINAFVAYHRGASQAEGHVALDLHLARAYLRSIRQMQKQLKLDGPVSVESLLRAPGVLKLTEPKLDIEAVWPGVRSALKKALGQLIRMREKEGRFLAADLGKRLRLIERNVAAIRQLAPATIAHYREQLLARVRDAGLDLALDDERLLKEVVFFADRCDISEELTRLQSHLRQFRDGLKSVEPVGRTLDFLAQEMNREINTIGSKANAAEISQLVVTMKAELERIREQVQNIE